MATQADGYAEREAALLLLDAKQKGSSRRITVGADKAYDTKDFVTAARAQRVSHTAIVENKRLRHALTTVKAQQDTKHLPKIMTNSDKGGYKKNPRRVYGPDYVPKSADAPAVEMTA